MFERIKNFFREVSSETKKATFPGKEELVGSTWVVIISVFVISIYLGIVDLALSELVKALFR